MATGTKKQAAEVASNQGIQDKYNLTAAAMANFNALPMSDPDGDWVIGRYTGSSEVTLSVYNNLPVGSIIIDTQAAKFHMKTGATTWLSSAALT